MSLKRFFNRMRLGSALDKPGLEGETYLTRAVKNGDADTVREFLDLGADPDAKNKSGELPLHIALSVQNLKIMHMLLETGADIFKKQNGLTLREHAQKLELHGIARALGQLEARKQEAMIAAASALPMGMMGVAVLPVSPVRHVPRDENKRKDAPQTPPKKPQNKNGSGSRGPG